MAKLLCMQKRYLLRVSESLRIYSLDLFRNALNAGTFVDDLPALPFIRTTTEEQLAGFRHELSAKYASVINSYQTVYNIAAYSRFKICFHREIMSCPTDVVTVRAPDGNETNVINTCSYNYLGYASPTFGFDALAACVEKYGIGCVL